MSNRWMNRDVGGKRQCVVVKNFNQTLVDSGLFRSLIDPDLGEILKQELLKD